MHATCSRLGSINEKYYQPVDLLTTGTDKGTFAVTLHDYSAAYDGFDLQVKEASVGQVNDQYFYTIQRLIGKEDASITFYSDSTQNNGYSGIGTWSIKENKWIMPATVTPQAGNYDINLNRSLLVAQPGFTDIQYTTIKEDKTKGSKLIQIPNSFSANNDGLNDYWEIKGIEKFPNNHVSIYNRWGELIFHTKGYSINNHFDASNTMQGVYMYIVEVRDNSGYTKTYTGDLTILR
jgi:gliding motility-associated-like protein